MDIINFLEQSNNIEGVFDKDSLQQAISAWDYIIPRIKITPEIILDTHGILMLNQPIQSEEKGFFRKVGVKIGARYGIDWQVIPKAIENWCQIANETKTEAEIKEDHIAFEVIHPFIDGNGRLGRILLNWQRIKNGFPILIIKNSEKQVYYNWFN